MPQHLYPLYIVSDATGRDIVRCTDLDNAQGYVSKYGGAIRLEPRNHEGERRLSISRRAEIAAIYRRGC